MSDGDPGSGSQRAPTPAPTDVPAATDGACEDPEPPSGISTRTSHSRRDAPLELIVVEEAGDWSAFVDAEGSVQAAATALACHPQARALAGREANVVLADDALVRSLNKTYRAQDKPTNVLSFPFRAPPGAGDDAARFLGDIILAAETLRREAAELGIPPNDHLQHLVIHGLLHLLGCDHVEEEEATQMEAIETAVLAGLGIADPYAP